VGPHKREKKRTRGEEIEESATRCWFGRGKRKPCHADLHAGEVGSGGGGKGGFKLAGESTKTSKEKGRMAAGASAGKKNKKEGAKKKNRPF